MEGWPTDVRFSPHRERTWTAAARPEAVTATAAMDQAQFSDWRRELGLLPSSVESWCDGAMAARAQPAEARATPQETHEYSRIKKLEKDLRRKEKALAEIMALPVLSKIPEPIFPAGSDD